MQQAPVRTARTALIVRATAKVAASELGPIIGAVLAALLLLMGLLLVVGGGLGSSDSGTSGSGDTQPTAYAKQIIPADMLALYQSPLVKQQCPGLSWTVVAAITHLESDDNRNPGLSSAGAMGANQFLPGTWDFRRRLRVQVGVNGKIPDGQGYGLDGDGDGIADIMDPRDSVPAAARLLCANGGGKSDTLAQAVFAYNHADWYVHGGVADNGSYFVGVLPLAQKLGAIVPAQSNLTVEVAVQAGLSQVGTPYRWGGELPNGGFDCSGLMQWAFAKAGIILPRTADAQIHYSGGSRVGAGALQRGDLVAWGSGGHAVHIGLYLGNGQVLDAPHTGALVRTEPMYFSGFMWGLRLQGSVGTGTSGSWQLPIAKGAYHLTAGFDEVGSHWVHRHTGQDFAAPTGTPIHSITGGIIVEEGWAGAYGNRTVIRAPDGTVFWYAHQSKFVQLVGQQVSPGTVIGLVGSTGNTTGPHVHVEVRPGGGNPVDPMPVLRSHGLNP